MTPSSQPNLYRTSDIGVSSDWRSISFDWTPVVTPTGVNMYMFLRDTFEAWRAAYPLMIPEGPTKAQMQEHLGRNSGWSIQGPEYLLDVVGLVRVVLKYGQSPDPEHPQRTHVAYYELGALQRPILDWPMLDHVLDALMIGISPATDHPQAAKAKSAIQALKIAGFLRRSDPGKLFWELSTWPYLLPTLIADPRWEALYSHLHTSDAVRPYREQAHRWIDRAQRKIARLAHQNEQMRDMIQAAQRNGAQSGGVPAHTIPPATASGSYQISATKAVQVTSPAFVANESLMSRQAAQVTSPASATLPEGSHGNGINQTSHASDSESHARDQLKLKSQTEGVRDSLPTATLMGDNLAGDGVITLHPHIREAEFHATRLDADFWIEVNHILYGTLERYGHNDGEKKAAERLLTQRRLPIGVVLAALRFVMTLPMPFRPRTFANAVKLDSFQQAVVAAMAFVPAKVDNDRGWESFLWAYRTVGDDHRLRHVSHADYAVLRSLFERDPAAAWEVLSRWEHADTRGKLDPRYIQRAMTNNAQAAMKQILEPENHHGAEGPIVDPRDALLAAENVHLPSLSPDVTEEFILAWIAEADARAGSIKKRNAWLARCIRSGQWPTERTRAGAIAQQPNEPAPTTLMSDQDQGAMRELHQRWIRVLDEVRQRVSQQDYDTWFACSWLADINPDAIIVEVPWIFVQEAMNQNPHLLQALKEALQVVEPNYADAEIVVVIDPTVQQKCDVMGAQPC